MSTVQTVLGVTVEREFRRVSKISFAGRECARNQVNFRAAEYAAPHFHVQAGFADIDHPGHSFLNPRAVPEYNVLMPAKQKVMKLETVRLRRYSRRQNTAEKRLFQGPRCVEGPRPGVVKSCGKSVRP